MKIADSVVVDLTQKGRAVFKVDGEPFPWYISDTGPTAVCIDTDLYIVHVEIYCTTVPGEPWQPFEKAFTHDGMEHDNWWCQPTILGVEFPWLITQDGFTYRVTNRTVPTVELAFFARSVEGIPIEPWSPPSDRKVRDSTGCVRRNMNPLTVPTTQPAASCSPPQ